MSALVDNPYMVDAQFQSDHIFSRWWTKPTQGSVTSDPKTSTSNRIKHSRIFELYKNKTDVWSNNFIMAEPTSYECFYVRNDVLYHGFSQSANDNIPMSDLSKKDLHFLPTRICYMHEYGMKNSPVYKMHVPLHNLNVLWKMKDLH